MKTASADRKTGIEIMGDISWGTHVCQFYRTKEDLTDILVPYFKAGLDNNEFCMWVTSEPLGVKEAKASLGKAVRDLGGYIAKGQIEILDYSQWYTKLGKFAADEVLQGWVDKEKMALEKGFSGLRLTGNTFWLGAEDWVAFREFEAIVDSIIGEHRMIAICTYSLDRCGASEVLDVMNNHEVTLFKRKGFWMTVESDERKRLKKLLIGSEVRFRRLFETAQDGILILDTDTGQITDSNPFIQGILGYTAEELLGKKTSEIGLFKDITKSEDTLKELQREGYIRYEDLQLETKDGKPVDVEFISNVYDVGKKKIIQCNIRDISERKEAEEVSEQYKKLLGELVEQRTTELAKSKGKLQQELTERKRGEEELRKTQDYLNSLIRYASAPIVVWDPEMRITIFNTAFERLTGYMSGEVIGQPLIMLFPEASREELMSNISQTLKGEHWESVDIPILCKDGGIRIALWNSANVYDKDGLTLLATIAQGQDITERKQMEEKLREAEERDHAIVNLGGKVGEAIIVRVDTDQGEGIMNFVSDEWCRITGYSKGELLGMSFFNLVHPKYREASRGRYRKRMGGESIPGLFEVCIIRKDGVEVPVELTSSHITYLGKDANVAFIRDITERKRAEESLEISEINLRSIIDSNIDGMVIVDEQGVIRFVNPAAESLFGRKSAELVGSIFGFTLVEGESSEIEVIRPDKTRLVIEARMGITEWEGAIIDLVSLRDITERKKMQEELIVSDRLASIGELVSGVAHEINNPLTGVIGFSGLLLDKKDLPDDIKEDLITISSEAERATKIIKNLLTFARKHPTESEAVNIHKLIENTLSLRAHQHMLNNIEVNTKFASDLPEVVINSSKLQQVFMNIIINAEFFMIEAHKKGTLTIATECVGPIVKVSFADDGPGISPENLGHLFDPFFTTKEIGKGTGLGLSICFGIISEAGGRIYAESQLGKGATFVVALPAATPRVEL